MTAIQKEKARDLEADLAICEAATPGQWQHLMVSVPESVAAHPYHHGISSFGNPLIMALVGPWEDEQSVKDAVFIAAAREGWPYAIRLIQQLELENERLHNELQIYQEQQERGHHGPWD